MKNRTPSKQKTAGKLSTSLIVGMLLVPVSAVAAVALVNPDASAESEEVATEVAPVTAVAESVTTSTLADVVVPEIASADDLALACGEQGLALVTKEADATISALEQAALDSLRAICLAEGLELPGPPAPDAIVETVTVVAARPPASDTDSESASDPAVDTAAAEFEADYAATIAYINKAIDDGARGEKIAMAEQLVAEAASLADGGDYAGGSAKLAAARQAADAAERGHHDDDDDHDEDDDHEDDDHEDEDHEDDDHEDEEDEEDEDEDDD